MQKKIAAKRSKTAKKTAKTASSKSKSAAKRKSASKQTSVLKDTNKPLDSARRRFVRDLLIRGEAAKPTPSGDLPPGATHRIVEDEEEGGLPKVERERFSLY